MPRRSSRQPPPDSPIPLVRRNAVAAKEPTHVTDDDNESIDGRRRIARKGKELARRLRVVSQFMYSRVMAQKTSFDVRLRPYKSTDKEYVARMEKPVSYDAWVRRAAEALGVDDAILRDPETGAILVSEGAINLHLFDFASSELTRKVDVLTTWTEVAANNLVDVQFPSECELGAHQVWEMASRVENHAVLSEFDSIFRSLTALLHHAALNVRFTSAAALWTLAEVDQTLALMPGGDVVNALAGALITPLPKESEDMPRLAWVIGALQKFSCTDEGLAALRGHADACRALLHTVRAPQEGVRRAAMATIRSTLLDKGGMPALDLLQEGAPHLALLITSSEDSVPVRVAAVSTLAHALRRALDESGETTGMASVLEALLATVTPVIQGSSTIPGSPNGKGPKDEDEEEVVEACHGLLWAMSVYARTKLEALPLGPGVLSNVLAAALAASGGSAAVAACGVLSAVALFDVPDDGALSPPASPAVATPTPSPLASAPRRPTTTGFSPPPDALAPRLLLFLEHLMQRTKLGRRHELLASALGNWADKKEEHLALVRAGALQRCLALCTSLQEAAERRGTSLKSLRASIHAQLAYVCMRLCTNDGMDPGYTAPAFDEKDARAVLGVARATRASSLFGTTALLGLARSSTAAGSGPASRPGLAVLGSAGVVEGLQHTFRRALGDTGSGGESGRMQHALLAQAAAGALWLLTYDEANATRLTRVGADAIMAVAKELVAAPSTVQTICVGIVTNLVGVRYLTPALIQDGAAEALAAIGAGTNVVGARRALAAQALISVTGQEEFHSPLADTVDAVMVSLASLRGDDGSEEIQLLACRALARTAYEGRRRRLLDMGATKELVRVVKDEGASPELLELALCALRNLSNEPRNQIYVARHCVFRLAEIHLTPPTQTCADHAAITLANLAQNQANRGLMYQAELQLRYAQWAGAEGRGEAPPDMSAGEAGQRAQDDQAEAALGTKAHKPSVKEEYLRWMETTLPAADQLPVHSASGGSPGPAGARPKARLVPPGPTLRPSTSAGSFGRDRGPPSPQDKRDKRKSLPQLLCRPFRESWKLPGLSASASTPMLSGARAGRPEATGPLPPPDVVTISGVEDPSFREHIVHEIGVRGPDDGGEVDEGSKAPDTAGPASEPAFITATALETPAVGAGPPAPRSSSPPTGQPEGVHERWAPPVVHVEVDKTKPVVREEDDVRARLLRINGRGDRPFTVTLDRTSEVHSVWRFPAHGNHGGPDSPALSPTRASDDRSRFKAELVTWKSRKGSRYSQGLFHHVQLPDGRVANFYYKGLKRTVIDPGPAPLAPPPLDLRADFGLQQLPPRPPVGGPDDQDALCPSPLLLLTCPWPDRHTLPVADEAVWYGTLPNALPVLDVEPRAVVDLSLDVSPGPPVTPQWTVDDSVFAPRKTYADSRSFWNSPKCTARAFEIDWARLDQKRFRTLIGEDSGDGSASRLTEVKDVLRRHRDIVYSAFTWYSTTNRAFDGYVVSSLGWTLFCSDCKLADKESPYCKMKARTRPGGGEGGTGMCATRLGLEMSMRRTWTAFSYCRTSRTRTTVRKRMPSTPTGRSCALSSSRYWCVSPWRSSCDRQSGRRQQMPWTSSSTTISCPTCRQARWWTRTRSATGSSTPRLATTCSEHTCPPFATCMRTLQPL